MYGLFPLQFNLINDFKIPWVEITQLSGGKACAEEEASQWVAQVENECKTDVIDWEAAGRALHFQLYALVMQRDPCAGWE